MKNSRYIYSSHRLRRVSGSHEGGRVIVAGDGQAQSLVSRESGGKGTELLDSFLGFHSLCATEEAEGQTPKHNMTK